jgi:hypothetical protein
MDGKPPTKKATSLYFFSSEDCSFSFFLEKKTTFKKNVVCPAKESNLMCRPNGKYKNLMEIISYLNVLIVTYNKFQSNSGNIKGMGLENENTRSY